MKNRVYSGKGMYPEYTDYQDVCHKQINIR